MSRQSGDGRRCLLSQLAIVPPQAVLVVVPLVPIRGVAVPGGTPHNGRRVPKGRGAQDSGAGSQLRGGRGGEWQGVGGGRRGGEVEGV